MLTKSIKNKSFFFALFFILILIFVWCFKKHYIWDLKGHVRNNLSDSEIRNDVKCLTTSKKILNTVMGFKFTDKSYIKKNELEVKFAQRLIFFAHKLSKDKYFITQEDVINAFNFITRIRVSREDGRYVLEPPIKKKLQVSVHDIDIISLQASSEDSKILFHAYDPLIDSIFRNNPKLMSRSGYQKIRELVTIMAIYSSELAKKNALKKGRNIVEAKDYNMLGFKYNQFNGWVGGGNFKKRRRALALEYALIKKKNLFMVNKNEFFKRENNIDYASLVKYSEKLGFFVWEKSINRGVESYSIDGDDIYGVIEKTFPYELNHPNEIIFFPGETYEIKYHEYKSDALRDSGMHWEIIIKGYEDKNYPELNYTAAEELSEFISNIAIALNVVAIENFDGNLGLAYDYILSQSRKKRKNVKRESEEHNYANSEIENNIFLDQTFMLKNNKNTNYKVLRDSYLKNISLISFDAFRGVSVGDINNDNYPDLFIADEGKESRLLLNQKGEGFKNVNKVWKVPEMTGAISSLFFDFNNDGCQDLLVVRVYRPVKLFRSNCSKLIDVSHLINLPPYPLTGALAFDFDLDGDLDLYFLATGDFKNDFLPVMGDVENAMPNKLLLNNGEKGFVEKKNASGFDDRRIALAANLIDTNQDGILDLYVVNDMQKNVLYESRGRGTYEKIFSDLADQGNGMGASIDDINFDGVEDIFLTNIGLWNPSTRYIVPEKNTKLKLGAKKQKKLRAIFSNKLFISRKEKYEDQIDDYFVDHSMQGWGWNSFFFDLNNDGHSDLYLMNGFRPESLKHSSEMNLLYIYSPEIRKFHRVREKKTVTTFKGISRSGVFLDYNLDGSIDLVVTGLHEPKLFKNILKTKNKFVKLKLVGKTTNRDGIGAKISIQLKDKIKTIFKGNQGGGFVSHINDVLTVGVGETPLSELDTIVQWPTGKIQKIKAKVNEINEIHEN